MWAVGWPGAGRVLPPTLAAGPLLPAPWLACFLQMMGALYMGNKPLVHSDHK